MATQQLERGASRILRRDFWLTVAPWVLLVALAFAVAIRFIEPAPPRTLVLAYCPDEGGAGYYARRYQEFLKAQGVTLELHQTKGSLTNLDLVSYPSDASIAFVQGGTPANAQSAGVTSLGALSYSPLWVFYRGDPIEDLRALKGRRLGVGHPLSGTRALATRLLAANGIDQAGATLLPLERDAGTAALLAGELDALFLVAPAESPAIQKLAALPGVRVLSLLRAQAYARKFPSLARLVLPRGVFDLAADVPDRDVELVSPTLNLLARDNLHPALAYLLMRAATEIHGKAGLLDGAGEFPAPREAGFPLSSQARRYYQTGAPFLQRYLPFWLANLVDRLWVILLPIIAVAVPLGRAVPAAYRWRVRSRLFRWYARLKEIELELDAQPAPEVLAGLLLRLEETELAVKRISTPLAYADNLYVFREHVDVVRRRLVRTLAVAGVE